MVEYRAKRNPNRCPTHPGELLREEILPALRQNKSEIARCPRYFAYPFVRHSGREEAGHSR